MWWIMPRAVDLLAKNLGTMRVGETGIGIFYDALSRINTFPTFPIPPMLYGIFTYIWLIFMVN